MLGWINQSIEAFITAAFGADKWDEVIQTAGVQGSWVSSCPYSDKVTYDLVVTAAGILGVSVHDALEAYGQYFIQHVQGQGYTKLLSVLGANVAEFLQNLNNLHLHLSYCWPEMVAPAFRCEQVTPESLLLHYYSMRPGLWPIVMGVLKGVASEFFKLQLEVELLHSREKDDCDHEVFKLRYPYQEDLRNWGDTSAAAQSSIFSMSAPLFYTLHPFHLIMDEHMQLLQWGPALARAVPGLQVGQHVKTYFKCKHPCYVQLEYQQICLHDNNTFVLQARNTVLTLKGQMLPTNVQLPGSVPGSPPTPVLVYLASPRVRSLLEMQQSGIFLSDIPLHDMTSDYILLAEQRHAEADLKEKYERLTMDLKAANDKLARTTAYLEEEKARAEALLYRMSGLIACFPCGPGENPQQLAAMAECQSQAALLIMQNTGSSTSMPKQSSALDRIEAVRQELARANITTSDQNQVQCLELLGEGTYGKVYKGLWKGSIVAVKTIVLPSAMSGQEKREKMAIMEAAISSALSHPNIMQTYTYDIKPIKDNSRPHERQLLKIGGSTDNSSGTAGSMRQGLETSYSESNVHSYEVRLICEYCDRGSLREALDLGAFKLPDGSVNYPAVLDTAIEIATAVLHLHHRNVLHSDLKARNIMLKSSGSEGRGLTAKVADFGLAVKMDHMETHLSNAFQGTMTHMAPEIMIKGHISKAADVYALGMVLWELYTAKHVFRGVPRALLGHQITVLQRRPDFPADAPADYVNLTQRCWDPNPSKRPTLEALLESLQAARAALRCPTQPLASYDIDAHLTRRHSMAQSPPRHKAAAVKTAKEPRVVPNSHALLNQALREQELRRLDAQQQQLLSSQQLQRTIKNPGECISAKALQGQCQGSAGSRHRVLRCASDVGPAMYHTGSAPVATTCCSVTSDSTQLARAASDVGITCTHRSSTNTACRTDTSAGTGASKLHDDACNLAAAAAAASSSTCPAAAAPASDAVEHYSDEQSEHNDRSYYLEHSLSTDGTGWFQQQVRQTDCSQVDRSAHREQADGTVQTLDFGGLLHLRELSFDTMGSDGNSLVPGAFAGLAAAVAAAQHQQQQAQSQPILTGSEPVTPAVDLTAGRCPFSSAAAAAANRAAAVGMAESD